MLCFCRFMLYSKDSISGTAFVQCLVSHLLKNRSYKLYVVWYCKFWFHQVRPIYIRISLIYRPTYGVLTVLRFSFLTVLDSAGANGHHELQSHPFFTGIAFSARSSCHIADCSVTASAAKICRIECVHCVVMNGVICQNRSPHLQELFFFTVPNKIAIQSIHGTSKSAASYCSKGQHTKQVACWIFSSDILCQQELIGVICGVNKLPK